MQCLFFVIDNFFVLAGLARIFDWPPTFLMRSTQSSQLVSISRLQVARKKEGIFADFSKFWYWSRTFQNKLKFWPNHPENFHNISDFGGTCNFLNWWVITRPLPLINVVCLFSHLWIVQRHIMFWKKLGKSWDCKWPSPHLMFGPKSQLVFFKNPKWMAPPKLLHTLQTN